MSQWFSINIGPDTKRCFTTDDIDKFGFNSWKLQVPTCAGGTNNKAKCWDNCQQCGQASTCCSTQYCPSIKASQPYYTLGPHVSVKGVGNMATQPYTFPLPLEYGGKTPVINTAIVPQFRVP